MRLTSRVKFCAATAVFVAAMAPGHRVLAVAPTVTNLNDVAITATAGLYGATFRLGSLSCTPEGSGSCTGGASGAYQAGDAATSVQWRYKIGETGSWTEISKPCLSTPAGSLSTWCTGTWTYSALVISEIRAGTPVFAQASLKNADGQSEWLNSTNTSGVPASATPSADTVTAHMWNGNVTSSSRQWGSALTGDTLEFKASSASVAASGEFSKYEWDLDGDGVYEISTTTNEVHQKIFSSVGSFAVNMRLTSKGGETGVDSRTIRVFPKPPTGEPGVSINSGSSFTNSKSVKLNLVWPEYVTEARISNDGGFASSKTTTVKVNSIVDWELDDSVKGIFTKIIYVRFNTEDVFANKTYSDDIILDTTAPSIEASQASLTSGTLQVQMKATDDLTGVDKVEVATDKTSVVKPYATAVSVPAADLGLSVSSSGVHSAAAVSLRVRVSDGAGNWSDWKSLGSMGSPAGSVGLSTLDTNLKIASVVSKKSIAVMAKMSVPSGASITLKIAKSSSKVCKMLGSFVRGMKTGNCRVTVTVRPKKGKSVSRTVTLTVAT